LVDFSVTMAKVTVESHANNAKFISQHRGHPLMTSRSEGEGGLHYCDDVWRRGGGLKEVWRHTRPICGKAQ